MNRILMDGDKIIIDEDLNEIIINGYATLIINNFQNNINYNITLNDNSNLTILDFNTKSINRNIRINQNNNSIVNYVHSFKNEKDYEINFLTNINGENNINNINIMGVNKGNLNIYVDGIVNKKNKNNELNENIRVLNLNGKVKVMPMLHISVLDVIANHNTVISNINENDLFYLNTKGIDKKTAETLIENAYIYGIFNDYAEFEDLIRGGVNYE